MHAVTRQMLGNFLYEVSPIYFRTVKRVNSLSQTRIRTGPEVINLLAETKFFTFISRIIG